MMAHLLPPGSAVEGTPAAVRQVTRKNTQIRPEDPECASFVAWLPQLTESDRTQLILRGHCPVPRARASREQVALGQKLCHWVEMVLIALEIRDLKRASRRRGGMGGATIIILA